MKRKSKFKPGDCFYNSVISWTLPIKIMAIADGYLMVRYKGCFPFVIQEKEFYQFLVKGQYQKK